MKQTRVYYLILVSVSIVLCWLLNAPPIRVCTTLNPIWTWDSLRVAISNFGMLLALLQKVSEQKYQVFIAFVRVRNFKNIGMKPRPPCLWTFFGSCLKLQCMNGNCIPRIFPRSSKSHIVEVMKCHFGITMQMLKN